jgi:hypothetical protein
MSFGQTDVTIPESSVKWNNRSIPSRDYRRVMAQNSSVFTCKLLDMFNLYALRQLFRQNGPDYNCNNSCYIPVQIIVAITTVKRQGFFYGVNLKCSNTSAKRQSLNLWTCVKIMETKKSIAHGIEHYYEFNDPLTAEVTLVKISKKII